jgi:uncharacterized protein
MEKLEERCISYMAAVCEKNPDPTHDLLHVKRVVKVAKKLAQAENANLSVVVPAAYLHDCVYIAKTDARRNQASRLSADKSIEVLRDWNYPEKYFFQIHHAILAHSFSAGVVPETLEAKIVQDADRLDAIGAVGIMRCFGLSGLSLRPFYNDNDPFCTHRQANDQLNSLDHFFVKLLKLSEQLNTQAAKQEAVARVSTMQGFLRDLEAEIM